jgi:hypothetical protein
MNYVGVFITVTGLLVGGLKLAKDTIKQIQNQSSRPNPALVASREEGRWIIPTGRPLTENAIYDQLPN